MDSFPVLLGLDTIAEFSAAIVGYIGIAIIVYGALRNAVVSNLHR